MTWGIAYHLWSQDRDLTLRCVNALATKAAIVENAHDTERKRPYNQRQLDQIGPRAAAAVRRSFWQQDGIAGNAYDTLDISRWHGADANAQILAIFGQIPEEPRAAAAFGRAAAALVAWWDVEDGPDHNRAERSDDAENSISNLLQSFAIRTSPASAETALRPILDAVDRHPRKIHWFIRGLVIAEDGQRKTPQFWFVWKLFADKIRGAKWLTRLDTRYPTDDEVILAIFLGLQWDDHVRHWRSLEGYAQNVHALFDDLPPGATVLDDYVRFLYHIGEQSLPDAFKRIAKRLQKGDAQRMLSKSNTVYMLEVLLQRYVYGRPLELKSDREMRDAVIYLLDALVEQGSSAAFRMRDDFVTPAFGN